MQYEFNKTGKVIIT